MKCRLGRRAEAGAASASHQVSPTMPGALTLLRERDCVGNARFLESAFPMLTGAACSAVDGPSKSAGPSIGKACTDFATDRNHVCLSLVNERRVKSRHCAILKVHEIRNLRKSFKKLSHSRTSFGLLLQDCNTDRVNLG